MGYDIYSTYFLKIPKDLVEKADKVLTEYISEHDGGGFEYGILPVIEEKDGEYYLEIYDEDEMDNIISSGTCIYHDSFRACQYTCNNTPTNNEVPCAIDTLKEAGVPVTGYVRVDWDGVEFWMDAWVNGNYKGRFDLDELAKMKMKELTGGRYE